MNANTFKTIKDIALSHHWQMIVLVYINDIFLKTNSIIPMTSVSEANSLLKNIKREDESKACLRLFLKPFWLIVNSAQNKERDTFKTNFLTIYDATIFSESESVIFSLVCHLKCLVLSVCDVLSKSSKSTLNMMLSASVKRWRIRRRRWGSERRRRIQGTFQLKRFLKKSCAFVPSASLKINISLEKLKPYLR